MSDLHIHNIDETEIDTILADDIDFKGNLNFAKSLMIKGKFKGDIDATGDLFVSEKAEVHARIKANVVSLKGTVRGDVFADTRVELFNSASVHGDITAPDIVMESGCQFNGICTMKSPNEVLKNEKK